MYTQNCKLALTFIGLTATKSRKTNPALPSKKSVVMVLLLLILFTLMLGFTSICRVPRFAESETTRATLNPTAM
jgi:hypothetical protein